MTLRMWLSCSAMLVAAASTSAQQRPDPTFRPVIARPAFPSGEGPVVLIDAAHHNFHTAEGRFGPFGDLLRRDGYVVRSLEVPASEVPECS